MKLTKRKGFNFFRSYYDVYNELETDKDKVAFLNALLDRQFLGIRPEGLKGMAKFAYISQTNSIDTQVKGYEDRVISLNKTTANYDPWQGVEKVFLNPPQQEKEKEEGKEEGKEKEGRVDYENIILEFNSFDWKLSKLKALNSERKKHIKSRIKEHGRAELSEAFKKVKESVFLQGENDRNWKANFDWIINSSNFVKIIEGNYDNKENKLNPLMR
tara:strand:+ start:263 stop:907 length:645 start_codon:yes stop_codon:yes gene_type:complete